jgi:hypothetical protein
MEIPKIVRKILENWCDEKVEYLSELDLKDLTENPDYYGLDNLNEVREFLGDNPLTIGEILE